MNFWRNNWRCRKPRLSWLKKFINACWAKQILFSRTWELKLQFSAFQKPRGREKVGELASLVWLNSYPQYTHSANKIHLNANIICLAPTTVPSHSFTLRLLGKKDWRVLLAQPGRIISEVVFWFFKRWLLLPILLQVNNYEIVVKFFHICHNLTWYSDIVHKFTRISTVCSTYELTKQFMEICVNNCAIDLKKNNLYYTYSMHSSL